MENYEDVAPINVGVGDDLNVAEFPKLIGHIVGFDGEIRFDATRPDGSPQKLLDVSRMKAQGWEAKTGLRDGFRRTYAWYFENKPEAASEPMSRASRTSGRPSADTGEKFAL